MEATEHQQLDSVEVLGKATIMLSAEQESLGYTRTNQDQPGEGCCTETGHHRGMHPLQGTPGHEVLQAHGPDQIFHQ